MSVVVAAAVHLLSNPAGHAQESPSAQPPPGEPPPGEPPPAERPPPAPAVQAQDSEVAGPPSGYARPPRAGGPVVVVRSDNPQARLQTQGGLKWRDVCVAPCNVAVNPAGLYRIGGGTIRPSDPFNMPRPAGKVVVQAQAGSNVKHWVGVGMIIGGVVDAAAGGIYYASASDLATSTANTTGQSKEYFQTIGIISMVTGVILLAIGIPLAASSTSVEVR
jgi:hypothetical protein